MQVWWGNRKLLEEFAFSLLHRTPVVVPLQVECGVGKEEDEHCLEGKGERWRHLSGAGRDDHDITNIRGEREGEHFRYVLRTTVPLVQAPPLFSARKEETQLVGSVLAPQLPVECRPLSQRERVPRHSCMVDAGEREGDAT